MAAQNTALGNNLKLFGHVLELQELVVKYVETGLSWVVLCAMTATQQQMTDVPQIAILSNLATIVPLSISDITLMTNTADRSAEMVSTLLEAGSGMEVTQQLMTFQEDTVKTETDIFGTMDVIEIAKLLEDSLCSFEEELQLFQRSILKIVRTLLGK